MGPILTFDKSFLQMLSPEEVDELDLQFKIFVTPILVSEILADLKHPSPSAGKLPGDMVRALARKMVSNHGIMQAHFRMLALGELSGQIQVPMGGAVLVDSTAPNVMMSKDGNGVIYDSWQDLEMWGAWAGGNFTETDEYLATRWREQSGQIDIAGIAWFWSRFCAKYLPGVRSITDVIAGVDELISRPSEQRNLLTMVFHFMEAPIVARGLSIALMNAGLMPSVHRWAPYCVSVTRLSMVLCCCLALRFVTSRPTNILDLQYLFYAPFGMVFVSHDRLQRDLWPAATTNASFVWGDELKADLKRYVQARRETSEKREAGKLVVPYNQRFTPKDSIIARLHEKHMIRSDSNQPSGQTGDFEKLPEDVKRSLREVTELMDQVRRITPIPSNEV